MKILGLPNGRNIQILTAEEIEKKAKEKHDFFINSMATFDIYNPEYYENCLKQPLPYKLFRFNELMAYRLNGIGCEITEEQYYDRLEQLPPEPFKNDIYSGYIVPECITDNIYEHIFKHNSKYYCVIMPRGLK